MVGGTVRDHQGGNLVGNRSIYDLDKDIHHFSQRFIILIGLSVTLGGNQSWSPGVPCQE